MRGEVDEMVFLADAPTVTDDDDWRTDVCTHRETDDEEIRCQTVRITVYTTVFFDQNIVFQHKTLF